MVPFPSNFPLEIIDLIIDSLATEDNLSFSSVKTCSLVSRNLLPRARTHIFKSIVINDWHPAPTPLMFSRLILQTPEIAYYVTSLNYTVKQADLATAGFAMALSSLTSLKSLTIWPRHTKWKDLPFREIILNLMHLPTLAYLHVYCKGFYLSDLTLCSGLKSLKTSIGSVEGGKDIEVYQEQPPRLESYVGGLYGFPSGGFLMQLCTARRTDGKPVVDISGLKKLSLIVAPDELDTITEWFRVCRQLTDVHLARSETFLMRRDFANWFLPIIQTLKHIHLEFYILRDANVFLPLASGFASLAGENIIESIKISIVVWPGVECTYGDEWGTLDRIFTLPKYSWRKLRLFSLRVKVGYSLDEEPGDVDELVQDWQKLPETQLRGLARSNIVMFDFNVSTEQTY